jgi:polar amino acid transport system substrate-binding protein
MSRRRQLSALGLAAATAVALAACGSISDRAQRDSLAAVQVPRSQPPGPTPSPATRVCTASLAPRGPLPLPGQMPAGSYMQATEQRGHLVAGVDQNTLLFGYLNPSSGQIEGLEIDILREVARAIFGNPNALELKAITTAQRIPFVQAGNVDIVADAMTMTCERAKQVSFSTVYYDAGQRVLVPTTATARGVRDLAGKRVCATRGSTSLTTVEGLPYHLIPYPVSQRTDCLVALQQGKADAISTDDAILLGFKAQDPYTKIVGARIADEPYGMGIARGHPEFVRFVNAVLARMRADGTWASIYSRWLGRFQRTPPPPRAQYGG